MWPVIINWYGFSKGCASALNREKKHTGKQILQTYLHFQKTLDKVVHQRLLNMTYHRAE